MCVERWTGAVISIFHRSSISPSLFIQEISKIRLNQADQEIRSDFQAFVEFHLQIHGFLISQGVILTSHSIVSCCHLLSTSLFRMYELNQSSLLLIHLPIVLALSIHLLSQLADPVRVKCSFLYFSATSSNHTFSIFMRMRVSLPPVFFP